MDTTRKTYWAVFIWLMLLLGLTLAVASFPFRSRGIEAVGVTLALIIAAVKATLVVLYFMHVRKGQALTKVFIGVALFWFGILIFLTLNDYVTRSWLPNSSGWSQETLVPPP